MRGLSHLQHHVASILDPAPTPDNHHIASALLTSTQHHHDDGPAQASNERHIHTSSLAAHLLRQNGRPVTPAPRNRLPRHRVLFLTRCWEALLPTGRLLYPPAAAPGSPLPGPIYQAQRLAQFHGQDDSVDANIAAGRAHALRLGRRRAGESLPLCLFSPLPSVVRR